MLELYEREYERIYACEIKQADYSQLKNDTFTWLCDHFCNLDGYCPTYNCGNLDRLKRFSDRQWLNTINKMLKCYPNIEFEDLVLEVVYEIWHKRPAKKAVEKYGQE